MASMQITKHAKERIKERNESIDSCHLAKRNAKIAYNSGYKIHELARDCPRIARWMQKKKDQNGNSAKVRLYQNNLYIWRSKANRLVTVIPLCKDFQEELKKYCE
jgi:hypothetical protein